MFNLNEWAVAGYVSIVIFVLWVISFAVSELWKYIWAWMDDAKPRKGNFIIDKLTTVIKPEWIYPVWLYKGEKEEEPFGYAKDEKLKDNTVHGLEEGVDYKYDWRMECKTVRNTSIKTIFFTVPIPFIILICIKFYAVTSIAISLVLIARLARFTRRLSKKYKRHSEDKSIHLTPLTDK